MVQFQLPVPGITSGVLLVIVATTAHANHHVSIQSVCPNPNACLSHSEQTNGWNYLHSAALNLF